MFLTKNFHRSELECPCCRECDMKPRFLSILQDLRNSFDAPLVITSGYRCAKQNSAVKGAKKSRHKQGTAVDISTIGMDDMMLHKFVKLATNISGVKTGIGLYPQHIHFDIRLRNSVWIGI